MSKAKLSAGIEELNGKLNSKTRVVMRVKHYKSDSGKVIKTGPQEAYMKEAACAAASVIIKDKSHPRYAELRARWNAQFDGHPEPLFQTKGKPTVVYGMFPVFVRMMLLREAENG